MDGTANSIPTKIVSKNCKKLADFYMNVFHCTLISPECTIPGSGMSQLPVQEDDGTGSIYIGLPGQEGEPVFEILGCPCRNDGPVVNPQELSFCVNSVETVLTNLRANGGEQLGELMVETYEGIGTLTVAYASDPEGNLIEIQSWQK